jgi:hypothetical protein
MLALPQAARSQTQVAAAEYMARGSERNQFVAGTRASNPLIRVATGVAADP